MTSSKQNSSAIPSKRIIILFLIVVLFVTATIVISRFTDNENQKPLEKAPVDLVVENNLPAQQSATDSDDDGLYDWQETLWFTDKNNADSDSDGTKDGEEVIANRDPNKPAPDDKIVSLAESLANYEPAPTDDNSLTSALARNLFANYSNLEYTGALDFNNQQNLVETLTVEAEKEATPANHYPIENFLTFSTDGGNLEKLHTYGNQIVLIQIEEFSKLPTNNGSIQLVIEAYQRVANRFAVIPVPDDLLQPHYNITNNFYNVATSLSNLNNYEKDPVLAMFSIRTYQQASDDQPILFRQISEYLKSNDIIFNEDEPGYLFYKQTGADEETIQNDNLNAE